MYCDSNDKDEQIKREIIAAAQILFQKYGFAKTTMEDIAKDLRKGKSTLYYYFKSKEEIFNALINKESEEVFLAVKTAIDNASTSVEKMKAYFKTIIITMKEKANLYSIIKGEFAANIVSIKHLKYQYNTKEDQFINQIIREGVKNREFMPMSDYNIDLLSHTLCNALRSLCVDLINDDRFPDWEPRFDLLLNVLVRGLKV